MGNSDSTPSLQSNESFQREPLGLRRVYSHLGLIAGYLRGRIFHFRYQGRVFLLELKNFLKTLQDDHNPVYFLLMHLITSVSKLLELVDYVNIMIHQKHDCQEFLEHN